MSKLPKKIKAGDELVGSALTGYRFFKTELSTEAKAINALIDYLAEKEKMEVIIQKAGTPKTIEFHPLDDVGGANPGSLL